MSQENKLIYQRLFDEYWAGDDENVLEALVAENHINHTLGVNGPAGYKEFMKPFREGLPGMGKNSISASFSEGILNSLSASSSIT